MLLSPILASGVSLGFSCGAFPDFPWCALSDGRGRRFMSGHPECKGRADFIRPHTPQNDFLKAIESYTFCIGKIYRCCNQWPVRIFIILLYFLQIRAVICLRRLRFITDWSRIPDSKTLTTIRDGETNMAKMRAGIEIPIIPEDFAASEEDLNCDIREASLRETHCSFKIELKPLDWFIAKSSFDRHSNN